MVPMKTIEIHPYVRICPECGWKPPNAKGVARYGEIVDHVRHHHGMGEPIFKLKNILVAGRGFEECEIAIFIR
jgi:hypothetical protein